MKMHLYYQDVGPDYEPEYLGTYDTISEMMLKIKEETNNGHEELPDCIPSYDEYVLEDFSNYPEEYEYSFHMPTEDEIKNNDYVVIIKDCVDDEYMYLVTNELL